MKKYNNPSYVNLSLLLISFLLATACSSPKKEETEQEASHMHMEEETLEAPTEPQFATDSSFQKQVAAVFSGYADLQEAFVTSDIEKVKSAGASLSKTLSGVQINLTDGAAKMDWSAYSEGMATELIKINNAADIKAARGFFPALTQNMYKTIKAFGLGGGTAWYAYCPMAFNNKGGYWLTKEKKVRNPYFGDAMLECGGVREQLK